MQNLCKGREPSDVHASCCQIHVGFRVSWTWRRLLFDEVVLVSEKFLENDPWG